MATSSVERSGGALDPLASSASLRAPVGDCCYDDTAAGDCSPRSPSVRAFVASFEMQHRPLCRTDGGVGRHLPRQTHDRPTPPCKTTSAVLKVRTPLLGGLCRTAPSGSRGCKVKVKFSHTRYRALGLEQVT